METDFFFFFSSLKALFSKFHENSAKHDKNNFKRGFTLTLEIKSA